MATYSIIGAGSSSRSPVTVFAGCETSVNICWVGRKTINPNEGYCTECYYIDSQYCDTVTGVTGNKTGNITWNGQPVYYDIKKNCSPAPTPQTCTSGCSDFSLYTVPTYVPFDYDDYIDIYYKYTITCEGTDGYIGEKEELSGMESIPFSSFTSGSTAYTYNFKPLSRYPEVCSGTAKVFILSDEDSCISGTTVDVTTIFTPSVVPALPSSGTDVTISISCKKVEVDKDCNRKITNSGDTLTWHVRCFSNCCSDHIVSSAFTMNYIRHLAGVAENEDAIFRYNGIKVPSGSTTIPYSITQKAKYTEECSGSTGDKETKYCVDSGTVKVEYETSYMINEWVSDSSVPFGGGRIKVSWDYSAFTYSCGDSGCTLIGHSDSAMTWEEIIDIPACDEMDEVCEYTERDSDGMITGNCIIYFKEHDSNCNSCEGEIPPGETKEFNKISYTFVQNCDSTCKEYTSIIYDKQTIVRDKCFTGSVSTIVPFTSITEYVGEFCPSKVVNTGMTAATAYITSVNNSPSARTVFENDMIIVRQSEGPCNGDVHCTEEWGTGTVIKYGVPATGGTYELTANDIPYTSDTCVVTTANTGTCTVTVPENTGATEIVHTAIVDATPHGKIKYEIHQHGTGPIECGCDKLIVNGTIE